MEEHERETTFDEALFEALRGCLTDYYQFKSNNFMVLQGHGRNDMYAVGFARQVRPELDLGPKIKEKEVPTAQSTGSTGLKLEALMTDHAVCLFEKTSADDWKVKECFGIIQLKMHDTNCHEFMLHNDVVQGVDLESSHGALSQEVLYTMGSVVLYLARNGIWKPSLPLAVIAGRRRKKKDDSTNAPRDKKTKLQERLRWVAARLNCPEICGDRFTFTVEDFGHFLRRTRRRTRENPLVKLSGCIWIQCCLR
jgi:hypothetical protein